MKQEKITLSSNEKIMLFSNFSTMIKAGISLLDAVNSMLEEAKGNYRIVLEGLRNDLLQGKRVHVAFSKFPGVFDTVTVNIVKASEEAGILGLALKDLKDNIRKQIEFRDKVIFALLYPVVVLVVFFAMFLMILLFVIPKFATVFTQLRIKLPLPTRILFFISELFTKHTAAVLGTTTFIILIFVILYIKKKRELTDFFINLPLIKNLTRKIDLARFTYQLHLLLNSGIAINYALDLCYRLVIRKDIADVILQAKQMVLSGKELSTGLKTKDKLVPTIMIRLIQAGEKTGTLVASTKDISEYLEYEVLNSLRTITALLEPIMLVIVGIVVGGMLIAIITPIYSLIGQINSR